MTDRYTTVALSAFMLAIIFLPFPAVADDFEEEYASNERQALAMLADEEPLPSSHSSEIVFQIVESIEHDLNREFFVNLPNVGQIANLPLDNVVETYALANGRGLAPVAFGELPPSVAPQVRLH